MNQKNNILNRCAFLYLCVPIIIFLFGWCKLHIAIILTLLLAIVFFANCKIQEIDFKEIIKWIKDNKKMIITFLVISLFYVFVSGIGGFVWQNDDHLYRNAIFENLVYKDWPIVVESSSSFNGPVFLVYYFAFWLPAALVGKIFGMTAGIVFLYIWSVIGVYITFLYLRKYYKKSFIIPIVMFIFFSGLDIVERFFCGENIMDLVNSTIHLEWSTTFQFSSFTTQLFWVFNQCIPAWIITMFILNENNNRILGIVIAMSLIFCTLPAIGLVFIAIYKIFFKDFKISWIKNDKQKFKEWFFNTFTWENIFVGIPLLVVLALFVKSNEASGTIILGIANYKIPSVVLTIFFEYVVYYIVIYKYQKNTPLYYISLILLLICPFVTVGYGGDFCMRASIPGLIALFIMILDSLSKAQEKKDKKFVIALIILLVLGSFTPLNEIKRTITNTNKYTKMEKVELITDICKKNFYGYIDKSLFYKYFAKK